MADCSKELGDDVAYVNVLSLGVRGYSCQVFDDPETAWKLHQELHLIAWRGETDTDLRLDRFDARNLLEDRSLFRQLKKRKRTVFKSRTINTKAGETKERADTVETEQQVLHRLRFGDYAVEFPPSEETFPAENKFPYQYLDDASDQEIDGEVFEPLRKVPDHLVVPKTKKWHAILKATANKVRKHPQLEVLPKVKLGANATFRFLDISHELHGYYCFLRDKNPQPVSARKKSAGVLLLGEEYDDDSDEEDEDKPSRDHEDDTQEQRQLKAARHHR
ncbi:unnamed protein product [Peronospora destructor]|uniref:Suppressor of white apricot N-terminal domain-containing protein n=1 Tax=Peronospora destructor TaxID=86335 RepID=A0AAV0TA75_9STRA|nr:unnamed protein product [Peronospora destructor]